MKAKHSILILALLTLSAKAFADTKVDAQFLGEHKLISNIQGQCPESVVLKEKANASYSVWITYYDEAGKFISNAKFDNINSPVKISNDTCMTAGPINPFCMESRKEITKYDEQTNILETFNAKKTTYSNAVYNHVKVQMDAQGLQVSYKKVEKPMAHAIFSFTPIETGATDLAYYTFAMVKESFDCRYSK